MFVKSVLLIFKMSQMYVSHSRVAVDLGKILQCGSAENKTAKLVEDIASEYSVELQALKNLEYSPGPAISHWILDAKTKRHIL